MLKNVGNLQFVSEVRPEIVRNISESVFKQVKITQVTPREDKGDREGIPHTHPIS